MATDPHAGSRAQLGARCRELLRSEVFNEAISALHTEYERTVMATSPHETEKRDRLILEYHALKRIVRRLNDWETDGNLAQAELDRESKT